MNDDLAELTADSISDQLIEILAGADALPPEHDTTLARRDLDGSYIVELVKLRDGARRRDEGTPILRITVQALA